MLRMMEPRIAYIDNAFDPGGELAGWSAVSFHHTSTSNLAASSFLQEKRSRIDDSGNLCSSENDPWERIDTCPQTIEILDKVSHSPDPVDRSTREMLEALTRTVDEASPWTGAHSKRVAGFAVQIGYALGMTPKDLDCLRYSALLHDIGKLGISASILEKPGKLSTRERQSVERHPQIGARILDPVTTFPELVPTVIQHHERFNGTGYPCGLIGDAICLGARILAVADVYDALASRRPYRTGRRQISAVEFIKKESGRKFDPKVVNVFLEVVKQEENVARREMSKSIVDIAFPSHTFENVIIALDVSRGGLYGSKCESHGQAG
jgi:putative nucleotidyltransferase with HDIG domain